MHIENYDIHDIKPYEHNPRINDSAVELVANSIKEFGFKQPIVIDTSLTIVAGHTRWKAANKLGLKEVPCVLADDLTTEQVRAYRLVDNKVAEASEWDYDLLDDELADIDTLDMSAFGFETDQTGTAEALDDEYEPVIKSEPVSRQGQIYDLGGVHRLMVGDSTSAHDVNLLCDDQLMDLVVTDPPYNVNISNTQGMTIENDDMDPSIFLDFLTACFENMNDRLKPGGAFYVWHASRSQSAFEEALNRVGLEVREQLIWNKNALVLGRQDYQWKHEPCFYGWKSGAGHYFVDTRTLTTVLDDPELADIESMKKTDLKKVLKTILTNYTETTVLDEKKPIKDDLHPTMKPIPLIARQIKNSSRPGENVLDLFGGSGTTLMACEQLGRKCYMMEYDPLYADVIVDRWEKFTGKKAVLMSDG